MVKQRIDVLGPTRRAQLFSGRSLGAHEDDVLQAIVDEAAEQCEAPIALVSLILDHSQFFRAHRGLPADLVAERATDRDASFCQFVVREEAAFDVTDAPNDERVPQALVEKYGIRSYLGVPVRIHDAVVGSLCIIDVEPRRFGPEVRQKLEALSVRVSRRLQELTHKPGLVDEATQPAFAELRNALVPIYSCLDAARLELAEAAPLGRVADALPPTSDGESALDVLGNAVRTHQRIGNLLDDIDDELDRVLKTIRVLETAVGIREGELPVAVLLRQATVLAHHSTKLVGGIRWPAVDPLASVEGDSGALIRELSLFLATAARYLTVINYVGTGLAPVLEFLPDAIEISLPMPTLRDSEVETVFRSTLQGGATRLVADHGWARLQVPTTRRTELREDVGTLAATV